MTDFVSNPYAPAATLEAHTETIGDAILFSGEVRWEDIERFGRSGIRTYARCLCWSITTAMYLGIFVLLQLSERHSLHVGAPSMEPPYTYLILFVAFVIQLIVATWGTIWFIGFVYARSSIAAAPQLLGPISGTLRNDSLELVYPFVRTLLPLTAVGDARGSTDAIGLFIGGDCKSLVVLPRHLFDERAFAEAANRLRAAASAGRSHSILLSHWSRTTCIPDDAEQEGDDKHGDADEFNNGVLLTDCQWTPACREQVARIYGLASCILLSTMLGAIPITTLFPHTVTEWNVFVSIIGIVMWFLLVHILAAAWRLWTLQSASSTQVVGWISDEGLTVNSPVGFSTYQAAAFDRVDSRERSIQLVLGGQPQQTIVLSRPMFASEAGFDRLRHWTSS